MEKKTNQDVGAGFHACPEKNKFAEDGLDQSRLVKNDHHTINKIKIYKNSVEARGTVPNNQ